MSRFRRKKNNVDKKVLSIYEFLEYFKSGDYNINVLNHIHNNEVVGYRPELSKLDIEALSFLSGEKYDLNVFPMVNEHGVLTTAENIKNNIFCVGSNASYMTFCIPKASNRVFGTKNILKTHRREDLIGIRTLFLDIDVFHNKTDGQGLNSEEKAELDKLVKSLVEYNTRAKNKFSVINFTGRGIQIIYKLKYPMIAAINLKAPDSKRQVESLKLSLNLLKEEVNDWLKKAGFKYTCDECAANLTQKMRLPGTINFKSGEISHIVYFEKNMILNTKEVMNNSLLKNEIMQNICNHSYHIDDSFNLTLAQRQLEAKSVTYLQKKLPDLTKRGLHCLQESALRLEDLKSVLKAIKDKKGTCEGYRYHALVAAFFIKRADCRKKDHLNFLYRELDNIDKEYFDSKFFNEDGSNFKGATRKARIVSFSTMLENSFTKYHSKDFTDFYSFSRETLKKMPIFKKGTKLRVKYKVIGKKTTPQLLKERAEYNKKVKRELFEDQHENIYNAVVKYGESKRAMANRLGISRDFVDQIIEFHKEYGKIVEAKKAIDKIESDTATKISFIKFQVSFRVRLLVAKFNLTATDKKMELYGVLNYFDTKRELENYASILKEYIGMKEVFECQVLKEVQEIAKEQLRKLREAQTTEEYIRKMADLSWNTDEDTKFQFNLDLTNREEVLRYAQRKAEELIKYGKEVTDRTLIQVASEYFNKKYDPSLAF